MSKTIDIDNVEIDIFFDENEKYINNALERYGADEFIMNAKLINQNEIVKLIAFFDNNDCRKKLVLAEDDDKKYPPFFVLGRYDAYEARELFGGYTLNRFYQCVFDEEKSTFLSAVEDLEDIEETRKASRFW